MVQKFGKISPSGNIKPIQGKRLDLQVSIFGNQGPREPPFSRAEVNRKRARGKQETRNKPKKGSNTPIGWWPGEFIDFGPFGAMQQHHVFFGTSLEAQKVEKLAQDAANGASTP